MVERRAKICKDPNQESYGSLGCKNCKENFSVELIEHNKDPDHASVTDLGHL